MESNPPEDSKSSTEDSDKKEHVNDDAGTGRFYECVFCKRGFTTAQALGGHMNIHRRDKAKNKHPTNSSSISKHFTRSGTLHPDAGRPMFYSRAMDYFPSSDSSTVQSHRYDNSELHFQTPWDLNLLEDNPHTNLSLQTGPTYRDGHMKNKKQKAEEEDELDLELRLGHDP